MKKNVKTVFKTLVYLIISVIMMRINKYTIPFIIIKFFGFYFTVLCSAELFNYLIQYIQKRKTFSNLFTSEPFKGNGDNGNHQHYLLPREETTVRAYKHFLGDMHKK